MTTTASCPVTNPPVPSDVTRDLLAPILVIDDNYAKRLSIRSMLEPLGHPTTEADSGRAAVRELMQPGNYWLLLNKSPPPDAL